MVKQTTLVASLFVFTSAATACATNADTAGPIVIARCYDSGSEKLDTVERPTDVVFGCDGTGTLHGMSWTAWDTSGADGSGMSRQTLCDPSCAAGPQNDYVVVVHAENVKVAPTKCVASFRYFSKLTVAYQGQAPSSTDTIFDGMPAITYDSSPSCAS